MLVDFGRLDSESLEAGPLGSAEETTSPSLVIGRASLSEGPSRIFFCPSKSSSRLREKITPFGVGRGLDWAEKRAFLSVPISPCGTQGELTNGVELLSEPENPGHDHHDVYEAQVGNSWDDV